MRKSARFAAVVGRRADLQCSVGAVNPGALYLRLWKLLMHSAPFIYTTRKSTKKRENM